jgi:tetratricopeptide (TPR) repeat protein
VTRFPIRRPGQQGLGLLLALALAVSAVSQSSPPGVSQDLRTRLQAAATAQQAGDAAAVAEANQRVLALALHQIADLRESLGLFPVAVELCKRSLDFEDSADTRFSLAIAYTREDQPDDALEQVSKILAADSTNAAAWNLQGKLWMMKKDFSKAADSLTKFLALQNDPEVAYTLATALLRTNQVERAAVVFHQLQSLSGDRAESHILAARAYEAAGLTAEAESEYKDAIARDAKTSRGHYFLGLFYLTKNGWTPTPPVREEFLAEVAQNPNDFFGNYFMGYLTSLEKNYAESDRYLKVAALAKTDWPEPYLYMGLNAYATGSNARAEELLRKAIELTGDDEARNNYQIRRAFFALGRILVISGRKEEGTKYLVLSRDMENTLMDANRQQALSDEQAAPGTQLRDVSLERPQTPPVTKIQDPAAPLDPSVWQSAFVSASERALAQESERQLRTVIANAYNDLAASQARRREYEIALARFHDAERWDPKIPRLLRNLGLAAFFSKDYSECARVMKMVVSEDPSDQRATSVLALALFSIQDYAEAAEAFDRVPDATLSDPRMTYGWALSLAKTNDQQRAATVLDKLVAQPIPPEMLVLAGQLYAEIGDQKNAQVCYQRAREQDPNVILPR